MDVGSESRVSDVRKVSSTMSGIPMTRDVRIRTAVLADAETISSLLREAFVEFEPLYTPGGFAATTPAAAEIAERWPEGTCAAWRSCRRRGERAPGGCSSGPWKSLRSLVGQPVCF
jgi:hypothetical protein